MQCGGLIHWDERRIYSPQGLLLYIDCKPAANQDEELSMMSKGCRAACEQSRIHICRQGNLKREKLPPSAYRRYRQPLMQNNQDCSPAHAILHPNKPV